MDKQATLEAVRELRKYDHAIITPEGVRLLSEPFGFQAPIVTYRADPPGTFKGVTLEGGQTEAQGLAADLLAEQLVRFLGIKNDILWRIDGRGSRLRMACDLIERHLNEEA